ncbi:hypothetical protein HAX54_040101 [Datura stramonium]|uniref:Uncharacterized protein n=1 Tax=Datura stramonium TaxID=4076 RepID=A0ABS8SJL5_DATST|nr:hypothetical protein [Datura stramonium]
MIDTFPKPSSSRPEDVQMAAHEAAMKFKLPTPMPPETGGTGSIRIGLSLSQIKVINESPLDSPKMWMELLVPLLFLREYTCPSYSFADHTGGFEEWDEMQYHHDFILDF